MGDRVLLEMLDEAVLVQWQVLAVGAGLVAMNDWYGTRKSLV
jgi:hypothetical protein